MWPVLLLVVLAGFVFLAYNGLVRLRVAADGAWSDIDVQLKRRHDLIPNLVETVKGYAGHESKTLEAVIAARGRALAAQGPAEKAQAENALNASLRGLFALSESYPQLRASENFAGLQKSLEGTESDLQNARRYYNAVVRDFNTKVEQFPSNVIANSFGFRKRAFFEIDDADRAVPKVSF